MNTTSSTLIHDTTNVKDINKAVVAFADEIGLTGASTGDIDLYELLQAYLLKPECRSQINAIVKQYVYKDSKYVGKEYVING